MDWKVLAATFGIVFLAELGDKTQLAALGLTCKTGSPWAVFIGASLALILATAIGVLAGNLFKGLLSPRVLEIGSAGLFVALGAFLLVKAIWFPAPPPCP